MAAPDFPASPTVGQTYTAPSGLVYTWDGKVWTTSAGAASTYWTDTGTALTPTVATRQVDVPGDTLNGSALVYGQPSLVARGRLFSHPSAAQTYFTHNMPLNAAGAWVQDDPTKVSWNLGFGPNSDSFTIRRSPAGSTTLASLLTVDNAGHVTNKSMASGLILTTTQAVAQGASAPIAFNSVWVDSSGGVMPVVAGNYLVTPYACWMVACAYVGIDSVGGSGVWIGIEHDSGSGGASWGNMAQDFSTSKVLYTVTTMRSLGAGWRIRALFSNQSGASRTIQVNTCLTVAVFGTT